ncbi:MAG: hypothetical protein LBR18_01030 [Tannerella sp.]|jgi:hypothetical protein|nr:hypothetical protein [Tannerella sp.]
MNIIIDEEVNTRIAEFYYNAAMSQKSDTDFADQCIDKVHDELYNIEQMLETDETIWKWERYNYKVVRSDVVPWYFAYEIITDTLYVRGAEYGQNMTNKSYMATHDRTDGNYNRQTQFLDDEVQSNNRQNNPQKLNASKTYTKTELAEIKQKRLIENMVRDILTELWCFCEQEKHQNYIIT